MYVDDIKLAGKTEKIEPTWTILMRDVDLGEATPFLDRVRRLEVNIGWNLMHFRKSHVRAKTLDVQEQDFSFTLFYRS